MSGSVSRSSASLLHLSASTPSIPFTRSILQPHHLLQGRLLHTSSIRMSSPIFNLNGLSGSREAQYFSKERNIPRTDYASNIELIRSSEVEPFNGPGSRQRSSNPPFTFKTTPLEPKEKDIISRKSKKDGRGDPNLETQIMLQTRQVEALSARIEDLERRITSVKIISAMPSTSIQESGSPKSSRSGSHSGTRGVAKLVQLALSLIVGYGIGVLYTDWAFNQAIESRVNDVVATERAIYDMDVIDTKIERSEPKEAKEPATALWRKLFWATSER